MVRIYDVNMEEVLMPKDEELHYGSYPLELILSSIQTERSGRKTIPVARSASLRVFIIASRHTDMDLKISNVFDFFRSLGAFYVAKENEPFKLLKVEVNNEYTPDIGNTALTEFEIPLTVIKPFYRQSLHTTSDIDSEGVRWNDKWGYGMGLSAERKQWKYSFDPDTLFNPNIIPLDAVDWEAGNWYTTNGTAGAMAGNIRTKINKISVTKGATYAFQDKSAYVSAIRVIYILHYNNGEYIGSTGGWEMIDRGGKTTFTAKGDEVRLSLAPMSGFTINLNFINHVDNRILMKMEIGSVHTEIIAGTTTFQFFNAGTESVKLIQQKESIVTVKIKSNAEWFEIFDGDKTFRLNKSVKNGDVLEIKGHIITLNGNNVISNTNRTFLTVKRGMNDWSIRNLASFDFDINFRFLYD